MQAVQSSDLHSANLELCDAFYFLQWLCFGIGRNWPNTTLAVTRRRLTPDHAVRIACLSVARDRNAAPSNLSVLNLTILNQTSGADPLTMWISRWGNGIEMSALASASAIAVLIW